MIIAVKHWAWKKEPLLYGVLETNSRDERLERGKAEFIFQMTELYNDQCFTLRRFVSFLAARFKRPSASKRSEIVLWLVWGDWLVDREQEKNSGIKGEWRESKALRVKREDTLAKAVIGLC